MNLQIENLFDQISDGIIVLASDRCVRFANRSARTLIGTLPGSYLDDCKVNTAIADVTAGKMMLPVNLSLDLDLHMDIDNTSTWLMPSPVKDEYVLVVRGLGQRNQASQALDNLRLLLNNNCREMFDHFANTVEAVLAELRSLNYSFPDLSGMAGESFKQGKELLDVLGLLINWAQAEKNVNLIGIERVSVQELLDDALENLRPLARQKHVAFIIDTSDCPRTALYGSRLWMVRSVSELLRFSILISHSSSTIEIKLHKNASSVQFVFQGQDFSILSSHRKLLSQRGLSSDETDLATLSLVLSKLIVEAYGGSLGLVFSAENELLRLQYPLSIPQQALPDASQKQCEIMAHDIANLLKRGYRP